MTEAIGAKQLPEPAQWVTVKANLRSVFFINADVWNRVPPILQQLVALTAGIPAESIRSLQLMPLGLLFDPLSGIGLEIMITTEKVSNTDTHSVLSYVFRLLRIPLNVDGTFLTTRLPRSHLAVDADPERFHWSSTFAPAPTLAQHRAYQDFWGSHDTLTYSVPDELNEDIAIIQNYEHIVSSWTTPYVPPEVQPLAQPAPITPQATEDEGATFSATKKSKTVTMQEIRNAEFRVRFFAAAMLRETALDVYLDHRANLGVDGVPWVSLLACCTLMNPQNIYIKAAADARGLEEVEIVDVDCIDENDTVPYATVSGGVKEIRPPNPSELKLATKIAIWFGARRRTTDKAKLADMEQSPFGGNNATFIRRSSDAIQKLGRIPGIPETSPVHYSNWPPHGPPIHTLYTSECPAWVRAIATLVSSAGIRLKNGVSVKGPAQLTDSDIPILGFKRYSTMLATAVEGIQ